MFTYIRRGGLKCVMPTSECGEGTACGVWVGIFLIIIDYCAREKRGFDKRERERERE